MTKIVPEQKAKQGRSGKRVLMVLVASLLLAGAVWYGVETYGTVIEPQTTQTPPTQTPVQPAN